MQGRKVGKFGAKGKAETPAPRKYWDKFVWRDYASDPKLLVCSWAAQGVWMRILCQCAQSETPGFLLINGKRPTHAQLARLFGGDEASLAPLIDELVAGGVCSVTDLAHALGAGVIYCRRMVRDARRAAREREEEAELTEGCLTDQDIRRMGAEAAVNVDHKRQLARARTAKWRAQKRAENKPGTERGDAPVTHRIRNGDVTVTLAKRNGDVTGDAGDASPSVTERHTNREKTKGVTPAPRACPRGGVQKLETRNTNPETSSSTPPRPAALPPDGGGGPVAPHPAGKPNVIPIDPEREAAARARIEQLRALAEAERQDALKKARGGA